MELYTDSKCSRPVNLRDGVEGTAYDTLKEKFTMQAAFYKDGNGTCQGLVMHDLSFQLGHEKYAVLYVCPNRDATISQCLKRRIPLLSE